MIDPGADPRLAWHAFASETAWIAASIEATRAAIGAELSIHPRTLLLLSGGTTPAPVYRALSQVELDWSRVVVSLVDDRDVARDADGSNAHLLRETLLTGPAGAATFWPLREIAGSLDDAVQAANQRWSTNGEPLSVAAALLGMGDDGHTASLFPGARNLDVALASSQAYVAIDATGCPVAGEWPRRISLTPHGLARARQRVLLIRGPGKRAVLERALAPGAVQEMPIRIVLDAPGTPLQVFWCA